MLGMLPYRHLGEVANVGMLLYRHFGKMANVGYVTINAVK